MRPSWECFNLFTLIAAPSFEGRQAERRKSLLEPNGVCVRFWPKWPSQTNCYHFSIYIRQLFSESPSRTSLLRLPTAPRPLTNDIFPCIFNQDEILIRPSLLLSCGLSNQIKGIKFIPLLFFERSPSICLISLHSFLTVGDGGMIIYELNLNKWFCFDVLLVLSHYLTRHT